MGLPRIARPYVIQENVNDQVHITLKNFGIPVDEWTAVVAPGTYSTPELLRSAVEFAIISTPGMPALNAEITAEGRFRFNFDGNPGDTFTLKWRFSARTMALAPVLGFDGEEDHSGNVVDGTAVLESPWQMQNLWVSDIGPMNGTEPERHFIRSVSQTLDSVKALTFGETESRELSFNLLPAHKIFIAAEGEDHRNEAIERFWEYGGPFLYSPDSAAPGVDPFTSDGAAHVYAMDEETARQFKPERPYPGLECYDLTMRVVKSAFP